MCASSGLLLPIKTHPPHLVVQWLGLSAFTAQGLGPILVDKLRSCKLHGVAKQTNKQTSAGDPPICVDPVDGAAKPHLPRVGEGDPSPPALPGPLHAHLCGRAADSPALTEMVHTRYLRRGLCPPGWYWRRHGSAWSLPWGLQAARVVCCGQARQFWGQVGRTTFAGLGGRKRQQPGRA